jgi:D-alanyl-D-alanine carboxypeptidase
VVNAPKAEQFIGVDDLGRLQVRQEDLLFALKAANAPTTIFAIGMGGLAPRGAAVGMADQTAYQPLTTDTPLRIASNTKMFVAATALRLWEQGRLELDVGISALADESLVRLLDERGYRTKSITVRQLLNHSAGLNDHADEEYIKGVLAEPARVWTREEQVSLAIRASGPLGPPGEAFRYSDTGYILLGDIIERATGGTLASAVRKELRFDNLALTSTWWEVAEPQPAMTEPRARQFFGGVEITNVDPTMDLYGGGGLAMSVRDLAAFTSALFQGRVFEKPQTLVEMLCQGTHQGAEGYRLGVALSVVGRAVCYSHAGFWGTVVYYSPQAELAVAGFTTERNARPALVSLVETLIARCNSADKIG